MTTQNHDPSRLRFALSIEPLGETTAAARRAEDMGFDYISAGEHLLFHSGVSVNAMMRLAAAASVTENIRLMTGITYAPLYPPAILTWLASSLDRLSGGRFDLGVGIGGEYPPEFELVGVDLRERGARANEALEVLRRLWSQELTSFEGRFNHFENIAWEHDPVQERLPVWIGGRKAPAMRRAARFGDGWLPYMMSAEGLAASVATVCEEAVRLGRAPGSIRTGFATTVTVYRDRAKARRVAADMMAAGFKQDLAHILDSYVVVGDPETCRERIRSYYDAGARLMVLAPSCPQEDLDEMLDLLVSEVLPEFRGRADLAPSA